ncbi:NAD(P)/FAD-dependent oxidoreductase [Rhodococcus sp. T2V]|uniref:flavin-containing monooxygenase n=1 Tax=Rhodococcus sp. T2V TaxID=3034164 RepID=UPI0023E0C01D|nr:NAD(P)/FAD-dependent oxidoreductase [Rhodococcus sp. T2V]MDF3312243.1 NAD(P)/FAD-dependent oxidoreductase [Rhodococcus sp. T2V]
MEELREAPNGLSKEQIRRRLEAADHRVLLMSLFHMTGDEKWLQEPYSPVRDARLVPDPSAGLSTEVREEIRDAIAKHLVDPEVGTAIDDPGDQLMARMMSVCTGQAVPPEYADMFREDMGFQPDRLNSQLDLDDPVSHDVLVVGAGVSGLVLGAALKRAGVPFTIVDRNNEVGGTWLENRYPGVGVDTPSHAYCYRDAKRPQWSRYFSLGEEVQSYLVACSQEFGLRDRIEFSTTLISAQWNDTDRRWHVILEGPRGREERTTSVLVSAIGIFNAPSTPNIPGLDQFAGSIVHSARWPQNLDLTGRRVAVIGTGASAVQIVPQLSQAVSALHIFQRSPQWIRPIEGYRDRLPQGTQWLFKNVPHYEDWFRFSMFWRYGDGLLPSLRKDPEWPHAERSVNVRNDRHRQELTDYIEKKLSTRPNLIEACTPAYPPYGKRILLDTGWYDTLLEDHVHLLDTPIERVDAGGVVTVDGERHEVDDIVLATGFDVTKLAASLNVTGRDGRSLSKVWDGDNPTGYLGITVPGFPNFFCMLGPNTGLGHGGSAVFQSESQARYILDCLTQLSCRGVAALDVKQDAHDEYVRRVDEEHSQLIWTNPAMSTYYRNSRGRVVTVMPWRIVDYWRMTHDVSMSDYEVIPW